MTEPTTAEDERAFVDAIYFAFGAMSMADQSIQREEELVIDVFLSVVYGIPAAMSQRARESFKRRVKRHSRGQDDSLVNEAFDTMARHCGGDAERKRMLIRLLFAVAKIDNEILDKERDLGVALGRAFHLSSDDIARCAALGEEAGSRLRELARAIQEGG